MIHVLHSKFSASLVPIFYFSVRLRYKVQILILTRMEIPLGDVAQIPLAAPPYLTSSLTEDTGTGILLVPSAMRTNLATRSRSRSFRRSSMNA